MKIIIGLGNPGEKYKNTHHNVGFMAVDKILQIKNTYKKLKMDKKFEAEVLLLRQAQDQNDKNDEEILLVKPQTFMNDSGLAVKKILNYYSKSLSHLYIIHDDLDIPLGEFKIQFGRSAAGHHGVESIISHLNSQDFWRIRIGIATEEFKSLKAQGLRLEDFVLQQFSQEEKGILNSVLEEVVQKLIYVT